MMIVVMVMMTAMMMTIEEMTVKNDDFKAMKQYFAQYRLRILFFFDTRPRHWIIGSDVSEEYSAFIFKQQKVRKEYFSSVSKLLRSKGR
jgi:hypothetical protein